MTPEEKERWYERQSERLGIPVEQLKKAFDEELSDTASHGCSELLDELTDSLDVLEELREEDERELEEKEVELEEVELEDSLASTTNTAGSSSELLASACTR